MFARMVTTALLALTAENLLFSGGAGFSRALRAARRPSSILSWSLFVTLFSFGSAGAGVLLNPYLGRGRGEFLKPAVFAAVAALMYLAAAYLLRRFAPGFYGRNEGALALSAANTVVVAVPYVQQIFGFGLSQTAGYALGTGVSFFLASLVLFRAEKTCSNPDVPEAFSGLPAALIYIGILSLAFTGFTGGRVF